jgi:hypothetical protein
MENSWTGPRCARAAESMRLETIAIQGIERKQCGWCESRHVGLDDDAGADPFVAHHPHPNPLSRQEDAGDDHRDQPPLKHPRLCWETEPMRSGETKKRSWPKKRTTACGIAR